jgi:hypothetical protein
MNGIPLTLSEWGFFVYKKGVTVNLEDRVQFTYPDPTRYSNIANIIVPKNDKFVARTYTFDITKCDEIFYLLVADGQIILPKGL